jgi:glycosyltransferase domain-containing protein
LGTIGADENPKLATLQIINEKMDIPIVAMWWDHVWEIHILNSEMLQTCVRLNVVVDTSSFFSKVKRPEKYLPLWTPQDPRLFYDSKGERDIPISFIGRVSKIGRKEKIAALKKAGVGLYSTGGQKEHRIKYEKLASIYRRSKIVFNFSASPSGNPQIVGRVMETILSGAMLLEEDNHETQRLFVPMIDYVPWNGVDDLVEKARYYLEHDNERKTIAECGCNKANNNYSNVVFWKTVFSSIFPNQWESVPRLTSEPIIGKATVNLQNSREKADSERPLKKVYDEEAQISILIPTLNRSEFLIRALSYYGRNGFKGWICIGDSSNAQHSERIKSVVCALEDKLNIIYRYFPKPPYINDSMCLKELIEVAPTPYLVYSGDDDFLVPSSLAKCAAFLENHSEYIAAHGLRLAYKLRNRGKFGDLEHLSYVQQHIWESEKASERWLGYVRHAVSTQYYVHRKETWERMYRDIASIPNSYLGGEFLPCSLTSILGKVKQLECLATLFQIQDNNRPVGWFFDNTVHPDWYKSVKELKRRIVEALMQQDGEKEKVAKEIFDREFWHHIKSVLLSQYQKKFGAFPENHIDFGFNLSDYKQNIYELITHPNWHEFADSMRGSQIDTIAKQEGINAVDAQTVFEKKLWEHLVFLLHSHYDQKYKNEPINAQLGFPENNIQHYRDLLSLDSLLNPSSFFHKDFGPVFNVLTGMDGEKINSLYKL